MNYRLLTSAIVLLAVTVVIGCGQKIPSDMPSVYPCTITLTKGGVPVDDAAITLRSDSLPGYLSVSGRTDENGVATIWTRYEDYRTQGAPAGEFRVTVIKTPAIPDELVLSDEQRSRMTEEEREAHSARVDSALAAAPRVVPASFIGERSTPLTVTVTSSEEGTAVTFEIDDYRR